MQAGLFRDDEHGPVEIIAGGPVFVAGKSVVVKNCWDSITWHIVTRRDRARTRRCCWTLVEALFYIADPWAFRALAKSGEGAWL